MARKDLCFWMEIQEIQIPKGRGEEWWVAELLLLDTL